MSHPFHPRHASTLLPELSRPQPNLLYNLDAAARHAGVQRRTLLIYCRTHLIEPVLQPPYGMMAFTEEAIYVVRRMEHARGVHGIDLTSIRAIVELFDEVEQLRAEVRFLRRR